ncbi:MAG: acyl-CoA dehydrogenase family protein [Phototrophicaceae bacterium]
MEFGWNDEQESLWTEIYEFAQADIKRDLIERDHKNIFLEENWQAIADKGILGLHLPEAYGGSHRSVVTTVRALEALGYGCPDNSLTLAVNGQMWTVQEPILKFGTDEQKQKYLPKLIDGTYKAGDGVTEADAGSDAFSLQTTATKVEGGYILNGEKMFTGMGPVADIILTYATLKPELGRWGITTFIVDAHSDGVTLGKNKEKMGLRTTLMGNIRFKDVFVPAENLLGREGSGASIFNSTMDYERSFIFASHVGSMARQLDDTIAYANSRQQGGQSIGKYQAVAHRIANMKIRLETARHYLYKCAWLIDQKKSIPMEAAMAKLTISECFMENSLDAVRVHGGRGYMTEFGVERDLRDAVGGVLYGGTSDIQRNLIAGLLGL